VTDIKAFIESIREFKGDILSDDHSLGIYATDASVYQIKPLVIVIPKDESDVALAIKSYQSQPQKLTDENLKKIKS